MLLDAWAKNGQNSLYASGARDDRTGDVILKVVNTGSEAKEVRVRLDGAAKVNRAGRAYVLASPDLKAENSLDEPTKIAPVVRPLAVPSGEFSYTLAPRSLNVLRVGVSAR